jgi:membrane protein insertase Oxa1/YidC/SpoIIIJ
VAFWAVFVDLVRAAIFAGAHLLGGSVGAGIFAVSLAVRLALLPITLRAARQMRAERQRIKTAKDKRAPAKPIGLGASLIQWPFAAAMFQTLRGGTVSGAFLWIRDLTRPDVALAVVAAGIAAAGARFGGSHNPRAAMIVGATISFLIAWRLSAGIALYSIASGGITAAEAWWVSRR